MLCRNYILLAAVVVLGLAAAPPKEKEGWKSLFNGKDLKGWDTYLQLPIGLNNDPHGVFSVVKDGDENVIRISGEDIGAVTTKKEYGDYHLQLQFRWGMLSWGPKKGKKKDSGLLYHSVGPNGADWGAWMRSQEFQIQEGDCGDYWGCAGGIASVPAVKKSDSEYVYDPAGSLYTFREDEKIGRHCIKSADAELASGEWNTLDLYCHGDTSVHVVNGKVVMVLYKGAQVDRVGASGNEPVGQGERPKISTVEKKITPLTRGRIQLQSEGAEVFYKHIKIQSINQIPAGMLK